LSECKEAKELAGDEAIEVAMATNARWPEPRVRRVAFGRPSRSGGLASIEEAKQRQHVATPKVAGVYRSRCGGSRPRESSQPEEEL
jgi:hypothetical protein